MTLEQAMESLSSNGQASVRDLNCRNGVTGAQFGVKLGDIRAIAKAIKVDHDLGMGLWRTGNLDAMLLATLVLRSRLVAPDQLEGMVVSSDCSQLADWLMANVVRKHPDKEALRARWMQAEDPMLARAGWSLTTDRVARQPEGLDVEHLLDRIDREMGAAPPQAQWTMNFCLGEIGIRFAEHRERAIAIGERLGLYRDWPASKGCVPPYVPTWVREMVSRQGKG